MTNSLAHCLVSYCAGNSHARLTVAREENDDQNQPAKLRIGSLVTALDSTINDLISQGRVRHSHNPADDLGKQRHQFESLLERAGQSGARQKFLCHYDATLRLVEALLLQHGHLLDQQPHAVARQVIAAIDPTIDFRELSNVRHDAKKSGITPPEWALDELLAVQQQVQALVDWNI